MYFANSIVNWKLVPISIANTIANPYWKPTFKIRTYTLAITVEETPF